MIISTDSWHYKLLLFVDSVPSDNLCKYFWQVMFAITWITLFSIAGLILGLALVVLILYPIWGWWNSDITMVVMSSLLWIFIGVGLFRLKRDLFSFQRPAWDIVIIPEGVVGDALYDNSFSKVTAAWLKAKKNKICPKLFFK